MAGAVGAEPFAAGDAIDLGGDGLEDRLEVRPGFGVAAGHDGGAFERAFLAAGDAGADVEQAALGGHFAAADGVGIVAVAAVDQDVAGFEQRTEFADQVVHRFPGADHHHDLARAGESGDEFGDAAAADQVLALAAAADEGGDLLDGAVVARDDEAAAFHVEDEVFAHDGEADDADVRLRFHMGDSFQRLQPSSPQP